MKKFFFLTVLTFAAVLLSGCTFERLPSEDLEVLTECADLISVLKNPNLSANSKEKYDAARKLVKKVDFSFTRETKTVNDIFHHKDAMIDFPSLPDRTITFNYQYQDHYIRFQFRTFRNFVLRVDITEK